jgi:hypothetical protein
MKLAGALKCARQFASELILRSLCFLSVPDFELCRGFEFRRRNPMAAGS